MVVPENPVVMWLDVHNVRSMKLSTTKDECDTFRLVQYSLIAGPGSCQPHGNGQFLKKIASTFTFLRMPLSISKLRFNLDQSGKKSDEEARESS